jgi:hypothetical protein
VAAICTGFLLLALLLTVFSLHSTGDATYPRNIEATAAPDAYVIANTLPNRAVNELEAKIKAHDPKSQLPAELADKAHLDNIEKVGLDLFKSHPLGLELAGVILLVSLIGAVVIAKKRVEDAPNC